LTVPAVVVVRVRIAAVEVHVVRVTTIVLRTTPIVAVRTRIVQRTITVVAIARSGQKHKLKVNTENLNTITYCRA